MHRMTTLTWLGVASTAWAGSSLQVDWYTINGGGITYATGGAYAVGGTIGQPDAVQSLSGSSGVNVAGGFWVVPPEYCFGDADGDGDVDFADLEILLEDWGTGAPAADFNGSGRVDFGDLEILLDNWANNCD